MIKICFCSLIPKYKRHPSYSEDDGDINLDWNVGPEDRYLEIEVGDQQYEDLVLKEINVEEENFSEKSD